jgi:hypothetical protein
LEKIEELRREEEQFRENIVRAKELAKKEVIQARVKRRKKEIEVLLYNSLREGVLSKKDYDAKVRLLEDLKMLIERSLES